ncbi:hypothetical protein NA57DRAFT_35345 [Rhizodiscina lignyota]|uniref:DUF3074 domain-containing protein n=1 Tax=Rhizodiscina lignyota TaxID=1504668 RepID=A0A9P4ILK0_9PEZI|nr:hypothetical protein NA57DRAFT_35345 [Rhizodiscina lignyota]
MSQLHTALESLRPIQFSDVPVNDLAVYLRDCFSQAEIIVNSVPQPPGGDEFSSAKRSRSDPNGATKASEMTASTARLPPPVPAQEELQKAWGKPMRLNARDNPLGVSVFKMAGHDRHGAWFARRSVHEGLGFAKWKRAMQREFPESLAVQGGAGEGSIRGIGGDRVLEMQEVEGLGKMEVYELSAKFPPPTSPRDFVTLHLTTDNGLTDCSAVKVDGQNIIPRHYMLVSIPIQHPEAPPRQGLVRGQYESMVDRPLPGDDPELNPVEWIMVTRSDPGGGIPRFLVDRGTPPSIAADAVKFLDWACAREDFESDDEVKAQEETEAYQEGRRPSYSSLHQSFVAGVNKDMDRSAIITDEDSDTKENGIVSKDDTTETSSLDSFASAEPFYTAGDGTESLTEHQRDQTPSSDSKSLTSHEKELAKIDAKKRQLDDKLATSREKQEKAQQAAATKSEGDATKARERHEREIKKREEKHQRELRKLEERKEKETRKMEARARKEAEKDVLTKTTRERDDFRQRMEVLEQENKILRDQIGELQKENTRLVAKMGRSDYGVSALKQVRDELAGEKGLKRRGTSVGSAASMESIRGRQKEKEDARGGEDLVGGQA